MFCSIFLSRVNVERRCLSNNWRKQSDKNEVIAHVAPWSWITNAFNVSQSHPPSQWILSENIPDESNESLAFQNCMLSGHNVLPTMSFLNYMFERLRQIFVTNALSSTDATWFVSQKPYRGGYPCPFLFWNVWRKTANLDCADFGAGQSIAYIESSPSLQFEN